MKNRNRILITSVALVAVVCFGSAQAQNSPGLRGQTIDVGPGSGDWAGQPKRRASVAFNGSVYLVVWEDDRNTGTATDIYAARVNTAGQVLDLDGIPICVAPGAQSLPRLSACGELFLIVWTDRRNASNAEDIYAARLKSDGVVLDPDGIEILTGERTQIYPNVASNGSRWLVVWRDGRQDPDGDIFGTFVQTNGVVSNPGGFVVAGWPSAQSLPAIASNGSDFFVAWHDYRNGPTRDWDIYGTLVTQDGAVSSPQGFLVAGAPKAQWFPNVSSSGKDFLVVWHDHRNESEFLTNADIYGARISSGGGLLSANAIPINRATRNQRDAAAAWDGENYFVVWTDDRETSTNYDIYGTPLRSDGSVANPVGYPLNVDASVQDHPAIAFGKDRQFLITHWARHPSAENYKIMADLGYLPDYLEGFEGAVGDEWSATKVSTTPVGARKFLGEFGNETVTLSLSNLRAHAVARVAFDLFVLRTWDGNFGPDIGPDLWAFRADAATLIETTFNNHGWFSPLIATAGQSYPGDYSRSNGPLAFPSMTSAVETQTLGYTVTGQPGFRDAVYHLEMEFSHQAETLLLDFSARGIEALTNESWGLDNVRVTLLSGPSAAAVVAHPQSQMVAATYPVSFLGTASGTSPFFYQWQKDGEDIPGATKGAWATFSARTNDAGSYRFVVSNAWGSATSSNAVLSVRPPLVITTLAGQAGSLGSADGTAAVARFRYPLGMAVDEGGNVYVSDNANHTIRKITPAGVVSTVAGLAGQAGSANGTGTNARFNFPVDVALDSVGTLYVAEQHNHIIRKITPGGLVTTLAGLPGVFGSANGAGSSARFNNPLGVAVDKGDNIYVGDGANRTIRKITPAGVVTTFAGLAGNGGSADGIGSQARFNSPRGLAVGSDGNLYVADWPSTIRKVTPAGVVSTLAGLAGVTGYEDGLGSAARFNDIVSVALDAAGNLYVADPMNQSIRHVTLSGLVTTVAGLPQNAGSVNGTGSGARLNDPRRIATDRVGNVYFAGNSVIRKGWPAWSEMPPVLTAVLEAGNNVAIRLNVSVGVRVLVEASGDLQQWETISDKTATESVLSLNDPAASGQPTRFYRAKYILP